MIDSVTTWARHFWVSETERVEIWESGKHSSSRNTTNTANTNTNDNDNDDISNKQNSAYGNESQKGRQDLGAVLAAHLLPGDHPFSFSPGSNFQCSSIGRYFPNGNIL